VTFLQALGLRFEALLEACAAPQAVARVDQLRADMLAWRTGAETVFATLAVAAVDPAELRAGLDVTLARIEQRIETAVNTAGEAAVSAFRSILVRAPASLVAVPCAAWSAEEGEPGKQERATASRKRIGLATREHSSCSLIGSAPDCTGRVCASAPH
jgi:hypothetical protein